MQTPFRSYLQEMLALVCFTHIYAPFYPVSLVIDRNLGISFLYYYLGDMALIESLSSFPYSVLGDV